MIVAQSSKARLASSIKHSIVNQFSTPSLIQTTNPSTTLFTSKKHSQQPPCRQHSSFNSQHQTFNNNNNHKKTSSFGVNAATIASIAAVMGLSMTVIAADGDININEKTSSSTLPSLPLPPIGVPTLPNLPSGRPRARGSKSTRSERPPLPNPGKFDATHRESSMLTNSQAFSGARVQGAFQMFPPSQSPNAPHIEKQLLFIPVLSLSQDGQSGMLNVKTELGHKHVLEGMIDTSSNMVGKYKFLHSPWTFKSIYRSFQQQGEDLSFECDYRGKEFLAQGVLQGSFSELILSYNQSITQTLSLGCQLHTLLPHVTFFNLTGRYNNNIGDIISVSYKNHVALLSYYRTCYEIPATQILPGTKFDMATEIKIHTGNKASEFTIGAHISRPTFKYSITASSEPTLSMVLEQQLPQLPIMLSLAGEVKYDGSNESRFGVGLSIG